MAKALRIFFGKRKFMIVKLGMDRPGLKVFKVYIYAYLWKTLTYFKARSNFLKIAYCAYTRPKSQVSVYMTIDYLVYMRTRRWIGRQTL